MKHQSESLKGQVLQLSSKLIHSLNSLMLKNTYLMLLIDAAGTCKI